MNEEIWQPILGFEGSYAASNLGNVRSEPRWVQFPAGGNGRKWYHGGVMRPKTHRSGHRFVALARDGAKHTMGVHRAVLLAFVGECPDGMMACHFDGNPGNNELSNLRWDTPRANNIDTVRHGRNRCAEKTHCVRGHLLVEPNLLPANLRRGHRACMACHWSRRNYRGTSEPVIQAAADRYYESLRGAA